MHPKVSFLLLILLLVACQPVRQNHQEQARSPFRIQPQGDTPYVKVELETLEGSLMIRLPELISDTNRRLVYSEDNLATGIRWEQKETGILLSEWREQGLAEYQLQVTPQADGLLLDWTVTNLGDDVWEDSEGTVCLQSHGVPALYDPSARRIFLRGGGQWATVHDTWKQVGGNWYLPPGMEPLNLMRPLIEDGSWKVSDFRPDEALMAVVSQDEKWILAPAWPEARYLIANIHQTTRYACTDVCPYWGNLSPGETVQVTGKIYFFEGTLSDLQSMYQEDLTSGKIALRRH